jgi:hypothetical protein
MYTLGIGFMSSSLPLIICSSPAMLGETADRLPSEADFAVEDIDWMTGVLDS